MKSESLNFLEPSGPAQASYGGTFYFQQSYKRKRKRRKCGAPVRLRADLSASCCVLSTRLSQHSGDSAGASSFGGTSPENTGVRRREYALCVVCECTHLFHTLVPTAGKVQFPHVILSINLHCGAIQENC